MQELLLTIDTATRAGSVAVSRGETVLGEILLNAGSNHTDRLLLSLQQLLGDLQLTPEQFDAFAVVRGPGSFTGLRVGVATVKGLALATGKPVIALSSLELLAMQAPLARYPVCALLDARKQEVYSCLYHWEGGRPQPLGPELVQPPERLLHSLQEEVLFVGDGCQTYRTLIVRQLGPRAHFLPWPCHLPRASSGAALALSALRRGETLSGAALSPCYIRPSEAEINWLRRQQGAHQGG
jgi:tRNA threonylcarbamoyladenosine biosynthesis protein TsaB